MQRKIQKREDFSKNVVLYYAAVGVIILGYIIFSIGDANSFTSLTLGPIVLVIGYLVAITVALLKGVRKSDNDKEPSES